MSSYAKVAAGQLKVGMYVKMPASWKDHPFLKNEFILSSTNQIEKIIDYGIGVVLVDVEKSLISVKPLAASQSGNPHAPEEAAVPSDNHPVVPDEFYESIHDASIPSVEKARLVRKNSLVMMENLLQKPSAENIRESKKAIADIVELILKDDDAANCLIRITDHDYYTYTHSVNVGFWSVSLAKVVFRNSYAHDMHELGAGFFLHDIGKVRINQDIITKPGRLTEEEMKEMQRHPALGFHILDEARQLTEESKAIVLQHHERFDGAGYPRGLRGGEIHVYAKICSIADVFDALTSDRSYRKGSTPFEALKIMKNQMIGHFNDDLFEKFVRMFV
jgi:HD-GYP domain-containing protein (c-di-GMP phosphodiesterase class II)